MFLPLRSKTSRFSRGLDILIKLKIFSLVGRARMGVRRKVIRQEEWFLLISSEQDWPSLICIPCLTPHWVHPMEQRRWGW